MSNEIKELQIISGLLHVKEFCHKTVFFIKPEYFSDIGRMVVVDEIRRFYDIYKKPASVPILRVEISKRRDIDNDDIAGINKCLDGIKDQQLNYNWLLKEAEDFCKDKALHNAIGEAVKIYDDPDTNKRTGIPDIIHDALGVSFDTSLGHDYVKDFRERYDFYHKVEDKMTFNLEKFNIITNGGIERKTLNVIMAGTGLGKSAFMCNFAAHSLMEGRTVLYFTMEMEEPRIGERIDANLMNLGINDLPTLTLEQFNSEMKMISEKVRGNLIIKQYPTGIPHAGNFRAFINELKVKKNITPDIVIVDYINICSSQKITKKNNIYDYVKSIIEELRSLAIEMNIAIMTATQPNRGGMGSKDLKLEDTADSIGVPQTADRMWGFVMDEELLKENKIIVIQLKNRYGDIGKNRKFAVGFDRTRMKFHDLRSHEDDPAGDDDAKASVDLKPNRKKGGISGFK